MYQPPLKEKEVQTRKSINETYNIVIIIRFFGFKLNIEIKRRGFYLGTS